MKTREVRERCFVPNERKELRRRRLHRLVEDLAIDELAPRLGFMPPSEYRRLAVANRTEKSGRTVTAILRAFTRAMAGEELIVFIGHERQAHECADQIKQLCRQEGLNTAVVAYDGAGMTVDRLRGCRGSSIVIDESTRTRIRYDVVEYIRALH